MPRPPAHPRSAPLLIRQPRQRGRQLLQPAVRLLHHIVQHVGQRHQLEAGQNCLLLIACHTRRSRSSAGRPAAAEFPRLQQAHVQRLAGQEERPGPRSSQA